MAGILDLPAELVGYLVAHLSDEDIFATRLTNKYLESSSLSYFGKRFFRKKGYLITTPSIDVLKSISAHNELRKYVQHVWFNPDCYTFIEPKCAPEEDFDNLDEDGDPTERIDLLSEDDKRRYAAYRECVKDHAVLLSKPKLVEELTTAFSNLPNLAAIGMRRSEDHKPWGWNRLKDAIGDDPRVLGPVPSGPMYSLSGPTKLFMAIINSVAAAHVDLKRLYTDATEIDNILPTVLLQEQLNQACRSLQYLEINVSKARLNKKKNANYTTLMDEAEWGEGLLRLFKAVPHLCELGLQIFPDLRQNMLSPSFWSLESWRKSYPYLASQKIIKNTQLSHLTRLKLEKLATTPELLKAFMTPSHSNLTSLKIRDIRLLSTNKNKRPWQLIFEFLRDSCPNLSYLLLYHLLYEAGGISFVENPPPPASYTGTSDGAPNPPHGEPAGGEFFTKYEHIALEASGRQTVDAKLREVVDKHWYHKPIFSYAMDEALWHTDTSDEEW